MSSERTSVRLLCAISGIFALSACSDAGFHDVGALNGGGNSGAGFAGGPSSTGGDAGASVAGGGASASVAGGGAGGSAGVAGAPPVVSPVLCNGRDALRFAAMIGGGNLTGIPSIVIETGFQYLLIDGHCRYYAMTAPGEEVRSGVLTAADAKTLSDDFLLGNWQALDPGPGCPDAGIDVFAFGRERSHSSCTTTPLTSAFAVWLERLYDSGSPVSGEVRYGVVIPSHEQWPEHPEAALTYPFKDPAPIATEPFVAMQPQMASGAEAATLRALRATYQSGPKAVLAPQYAVPVKVESADAAPTYYNLVMRDTVPFETNNYLSLDDVIE